MDKSDEKTNMLPWLAIILYCFPGGGGCTLKESTSDSSLPHLRFRGLYLNSWLDVFLCCFSPPKTNMVDGTGLARLFSTIQIEGNPRLPMETATKNSLASQASKIEPVSNQHRTTQKKIQSVAYITLYFPVKSLLPVWSFFSPKISSLGHSDREIQARKKMSPLVSLHLPKKSRFGTTAKEF